MPMDRPSSRSVFSYHAIHGGGGTFKPIQPVDCRYNISVKTNLQNLNK